MEFKKDSVEKHYEFSEELGRGQFAVVNLCLHKVTREKFAAKCIQKKSNSLLSSSRGVEIRTIRQEVSILSSLEHENIVRLFEVFESKSTVTLMLEYVEGGELFALVSERDRLDEDEASCYVRQLLAGLSYMHENGVVHLDLKPENIMLEHAGSENAQIVKIIDFGLAQRLVNGKPLQIDPHGTAEFIPPEVLACEPVATSADLWTVGVIIYVLLSGLSPFAADSEGVTFSRILAASYTFYDEPFATVTDLAKDLIYKLIQRKPTDRLTAEQALTHPWINPVCTEQRLLRKRSKVKRENLLRLKRYVNPRTRWKQTVGVIKVVNQLARSRRSQSQSAIDTTSCVCSTNNSTAEKAGSETRPRSVGGQPFGTLPNRKDSASANSASGILAKAIAHATGSTVNANESNSTMTSSTNCGRPSTSKGSAHHPLSLSQSHLHTAAISAPAKTSNGTGKTSDKTDTPKRGAINNALLNIRSLLKPVTKQQNK